MVQDNLIYLFDEFDDEDPEDGEKNLDDPYGLDDGDDDEPYGDRESNETDGALEE